MSEARVIFRDFPYEPELHIELRATNGEFSATQGFYCHAEDLVEFGDSLCSFPRDVNHEVRFELGDPDPKWAYHIVVRAYAYDSVGHSAVEIFVQNRFEPPHGAEASFSIVCDPAAINRLGESLKSWARNRDRPLAWVPFA